MQGVAKALALSGLALLAGPLCFTAQAQDYVDVEAERRVAASGQSTGYGSGSSATTQGSSYPATSYGLNSAPATSQVATPPPPVAGSGGQDVGTLLYQLQLLQQEVMTLNGRVEEQAHEIRRLKEQSMERYVDLDRRVSAVAGGAPASSAVASQSTSTSGSAEPPAASSRPAVTAPVATTGAEQPGEGEAYRAAYALVRAQQFDQAVTAFNQFLQNFPGGRYAPNAHYWLGELYLVVQPQDLESSRQAFMLLLDQYPDNPKVPDALYKLGKVHFLKGNRERAREFLDRVVRDYGNSNSSAARLAREFIAENY